MFNDMPTEDRDLGRQRSIDLGNNKINITSSDPYGFWTISYQRGQVPESLQGNYTTHEMALKAVELYLRDKKKDK